MTGSQVSWSSWNHKWFDFRSERCVDHVLHIPSDWMNFPGNKPKVKHHSHVHIISRRGEVWAHKTTSSLTHPFDLSVCTKPGMTVVMYTGMCVKATRRHQFLQFFN